MSTFVHAAAMGLLSRTLQTLLSKYLADVDVQGVALPSAFGSNDNSGWGVRLSNVKLRDGTKLMSLQKTAGKKTPKEGQRQKRPRRRKTNPAKKVEKEPVVVAVSPDDEVQQASLAAAPSGADEAAADLSVAAELLLETATATVMDTSNSFEPPPPPLVPKRSSWFSSWLYGDSSSNSNDHDEEESTAYNGGECSDNTETEAAEADIRNGHCENGIEDACMPPSVAATATTMSDVDNLVGLYPQYSAAGVPINEVEEETVPPGYDDDDDEEEETDYNKGDDDEDELPMILRLGKEGTIGTLDVRLVGKTIHVLVEDAVLTVEAVRLAPPAPIPNEHDPSAGTNTTGGNGTATGTPTENDATASSSTTKQKKQKVPDPKTVGDRILAQNAVARIFSAIPNLFLRDVRIRVVLRNDTVVDDENDSTPNHDYRDTDTVLEVSIELLSVTEGEDFLLNFGESAFDDDTSTDEDDVDDDIGNGVRTSSDAGDQPIGSAVSVGDTNEFLTKRMRTGRGPEGGILLKIYEAGDDLYNNSHLHQQSKQPQNVWARDAWRASTEFVVLRLSGLDLHARIYLGTKKEIAMANQGWYVEDNHYEDFSVDAMLFGGVDYIAPGPQPTLPPISRHELSGNSMEFDTKAHAGAATFFKDSNGIQSCRLPSPFHRVARGMYRRYCSNDHLPCEYCHHCWTKDAGESKTHVLDSSTPLGGLVFHVSVRDPMEVNVDRRNLAVIGLLVGLFSKKNTDKPPPPRRNESSGAVNASSEDNASSALSPGGDSERSVRSQASSFIDDSTHSRMSRHGSRVFDESSRSSITMSNHRRNSVPDKAMSYQDYDVASSFPTYLQPEKIQILGIYIVEIKFRLHVMQEGGRAEDGRSYCYWDLLGKCVTVDHQKSTAAERPFQDLRFDIGNLKVTEFKGVERKQTISLGFRQREADVDDMSLETFMTAEKNHKRSPWPSTAAALLDVPPTLESLLYEERDRHGLQIRYVAILDSKEDCDRVRKDVNVRLGVASIDVPFAIRFDIMRILREARSTVLGPPTPILTDTLQRTIDSLLRYKVIAEGGNVNMEPLISGSLPLTTVRGELSTRAGFSLKAVLDELKVAYGKPSAIRALDKGLSLHQLAQLPDNVRLRVLLFLKDLKPLEAALGLVQASNPFLRCRAVNKGIVKMSKDQVRKMDDVATVVVEADPIVRRQLILDKLLALDDRTLENLLETHRRSQSKENSK